jgi:hypothetical protein
VQLARVILFSGATRRALGRYERSIRIEWMVRSRGLRTSTPLLGYMHLKHAFADSATTANFNLVATTGSNAYLKLSKCVQERSLSY